MSHTSLLPPDSEGSRPDTFWCKVTGHLPCKGQTKQDLGISEIALTYTVKNKTQAESRARKYFQRPQTCARVHTLSGDSRQAPHSVLVSPWVGPQGCVDSPSQEPIFFFIFFLQEGWVGEGAVSHHKSFRTDSSQLPFLPQSDP